jgi:hypothetical protein
VTERNGNSIGADGMELIKHFWYRMHVVTERNGNSISADITDDTIENN